MTRSFTLSTHDEKASEHRLEDGRRDYDFGGESQLPPPPDLSQEDERKLWRKIDLRLMPILCVIYLMSFMDRGNAKLQGLETQLKLTGNRYNIALFGTEEIPPFHLAPWHYCCLGYCHVGMAPFELTTLMGLVKTYPQLVGLRVCLGIAEAGLFPGVAYYLSLWYPRNALQSRIGLFFGAATIAGAFSGLFAFAVSFMSGTRGLLGWSWIFIIEGIITVAVGLISFPILVDFPVTADFLTPEERAFVVWKKKFDNSSVGEEERFMVEHVYQAFTDWQVWIHLLIYISLVGPLYGITLFLPTIISDFGEFSTAISQLLTVPPYIFATIVLGLFAYYSDKVMMRSPFILAAQIMCLIGFSINIANVSTGAKYLGTFLIVAGSYAGFPGIVAWLGNNLCGQYKRGVGMALHIGIGNFSGAIASNIFRTQDKPRFILGHAIELMFVGIGLICLPITVIIYSRINKKRAYFMSRVADGLERKPSPEELRELGDRAPDFQSPVISEPTEFLRVATVYLRYSREYKGGFPDARSKNLSTWDDEERSAWLLLGISHPQLIYELHGDGLLSLFIKYTGFLNHKHLLVNEKALLLKITTDSSASTLVFSRLINSNKILRIQRMEMLSSFIPYGAAELHTASVFES
ncbi:major facilitator superfamily domain-containing protein [Lentinula lateritia]|nr:major facilitator superfamily domain-containing protein [Lentinula lateritia]